mmetsp:Transcript_78550/g.163197  ORF Transcript_78550/g.163197 Transcript_78550/m.163197 type:complete len:475 (-) Transcript_78550:31-1455(-)|eukprot:CAMPEP_0206459366 /NCGR_PEP_ID=MMETSP0324_2-20121206/24131_1 /ASSEMBLY_ACC=CAM_ASM_000836 /TAXON_ID=2866 /ORGANISM="Crypthecodinium cohnii, Strain Seligo" /LENGTH=474 /DNA_ID=CAMNT_0053930899 /DNA_START=123 /DNA_END=1547 /DNA_ORIENTATION=-
MFGFTKIEVQTYVVLCIAIGLQVFINQMEQPYARSLVVCDTPVNTTAGAESTGSSHCGDRLHVISEGAWLSGSGESLENIGRFLITLFVSGFADSHGRKAAAVLGWSLISLSVLCFYLASFIPAWAKVLFVVAQGLQGMSGIGLIMEIVVRDIANKMEGDTTAFFARKNFLSMFLGMLFFFQVMVIQHRQITEFRMVWGVILVATLAVEGMLIAQFPETQDLSKRKSVENLTLKAIVLDEGKIFKKMVEENQYIKLGLVEAGIGYLSGACLVIFTPWCMAHHGLSQFQMLVYMLPQVFLGIAAHPIIPGLVKKFGHKRVWNNVYFLERILDTVFLPMMLVNINGFPFPLLTAYIKTPLSGIGSLREAIAAKRVPAEYGAKYAAAHQLINFLVSSVGAMLFTQLFDAEAKSVFVILLPFIVGSIVRWLSLWSYYNGFRDICWEACDDLTADEKAKEEKEAAEKEKAKTEEEKKED